MIEIVALIVSGFAFTLATVALLLVRGVRGELDRAIGREEGAAQERAIAAQARMDRAAATALVLHPEAPAPTGPTEVVIVGQAEPVPVQVVVPVPVVTPEDEGG